MLSQNVARTAKSFHLAVSEFVAFLRRPDVRSHNELLVREKAGIGIGLFVLSIIVTMIFGMLGLPLILSTDLTTGEKLNDVLGSSIWSVVLSVVILGPLVEEIIFRGWLTGTWRSVLASAFSLAAIYGGAALLDPYPVVGDAIKTLVLVGGAIAIFVAFLPLDKTRHISGFDRIFPIIFYAQAVAFGILHFQNFAASSLAVALFATLPLVACGLIWGYARVRLGLASAVILHAAYNLPAAVGSMVMLHFAV